MVNLAAITADLAPEHELIWLDSCSQKTSSVKSQLNNADNVFFTHAQLISVSIGLRLSEREERVGADVVEHGTLHSELDAIVEDASTVRCLLGVHQRDNATAQTQADERVTHALFKLLSYFAQSRSDSRLQGLG